MVVVANIKRTLRIWTWMHEMYVWGRSLSQICPIPSQLLTWSSVLCLSLPTRRCALCGLNYQFVWKGLGKTHRHIAYTRSSDYCRTRTHSQKMSVTFWRLHWNCLHTFDHLRQWRVHLLDLCVLCDEQEETLEHIFINYAYLRSIWMSFVEMTGNVIWKSMNRSIMMYEDLQVDVVIKGTQRFGSHTKAWSLL